MTELTQQHSASDAVGIINANLESLDVDVTLTSEDSASSVCDKLNGVFDALDEPTELTSEMSGSEFVEAVNANMEALEEHDDGVGELTFLHFSDTHASGNNGSLKKASELMAQEGNENLISVLSGDCYSYLGSTKMSLGNYASGLVGSRLILCPGNHDSYPDPNSGYSSSELAGWQTAITANIKTKMTNAGIKWGDTDGVNNTPITSCYCYWDIKATWSGANKTVRFIMLDQYELDAVGIPGNVTDSTDHGGSKFLELYSAAQIQWFINTLKSMRTDDVDYFVVVLHSPPVTDTDANKSALVAARRNNKFIAATHGNGNDYWGSAKGSVWASIVDAYLNQSAVNVDFYNFKTDDTTMHGSANDHVQVTDSFVGVTPVPLLFYLCGHIHREYCGYHPEYPNQLILCVDPSKHGDGFSDLNGKSNNDPWESDIVINKVTVNFATRKTTIERIGLQSCYAANGKPATTRDWIQFNFKRKNNEYCESEGGTINGGETNEE